MDTVIKQQSIVYGLWGKQPNGTNAYFILLVNKAKHQHFDRILTTEEGFDVKDFGEILHQGWNPPHDELKDQFRKKYGLYETER